MEGRGRKVIVASAEVVARILKRGEVRAYTTNAPADMEVLGAVETREDVVTGSVRFVCDSAEWGPNPEGSAYPTFELEFYAREDG